MRSYTYGTTPQSVIADALGDKPYPMELVGEDVEALTSVVNQGIDSHLEAVTDSQFDWRGHRLVCSVAPKDMLVILRRLAESDEDNAMSLRSGILTTLDIEEI